MALREWAQKTLSREAGEEGAKPAMIRLTGDGTVWETWSAPFELETFLLEAAAVQSSIADECPIRRVPLLFSAETSTGSTVSQYPTSVQGKNKHADALAGSGNGAAKAFAEAMEGISRVVVAVLKSAEVQVTSLTKTLESQSTQIHELIEYARTKQELEIVEAKENNSTQEMLMAQVKEVLPLIPEALDLWLKERKNSPAAPAVAAVAKEVAKTLVNGAA